MWLLVNIIVMDIEDIESEAMSDIECDIVRCFVLYSVLSIKISTRE